MCLVRSLGFFFSGHGFRCCFDMSYCICCVCLVVWIPILLIGIIVLNGVLCVGWKSCVFFV